MQPEKEVTIYDIAKALNISPATVSRGLKDHSAISKNTRKRIFEAAQAMGYRFNSFASNLRRQKTNTIGVIVPRLNSAFMSDAIAGMEKVLNEAGYNLIISQSLEDTGKEEKNAVTMFNSRVDGLIVSLSYNTRAIPHFEQFIRRGIPLIFFDRIYEDSECPSIVINNYEAAYGITTHLIGEGCKRIVHITGNESGNVYRQRFEGYRDALKDGGIEWDKQCLIVNTLTSGDGEHAAEAILKMKRRPDGIFVANDNCAVSCMLSLKRQGIKVPDDIAIAGFNNDPISRVAEPNLTTIDYKGYEMGEVAAKTLIDRLNGTSGVPITNSLILKHEIIVRDSSLKNSRTKHR
ncbi:LacI family DNA-binding transcriptional regulator [Pararcticibacter amylolyticus]|uniref:LacI family transcriptional regulator n=1 Tax=Pararcticibacter amylolyticus TaxID=2173175 RepID=A0A2U2PA53_9SPHI|nr:LacI family DNA-binding transcriptional regulator [Pararcticibacter amylolyticus]PWG78262.1 LacI family transcriptional regulator [Pararcticibacter amylolyticus]